MKRSWLIGLTVISFCVGILLFAHQYEYLIIRLPQKTTTIHQLIETKKTVVMHYWKDHQWHKETQEMIWSQNMVQNIQRLLNYWLRLLEEYDIINKHITIQSVAIAPNEQNLFVSFDRNPLLKNWSIFHKWMFVEGLLQTIRSNTDHLLAILFLIRHQKLTDMHLDFSHPWPIIGYKDASLQ